MKLKFTPLEFETAVYRLELDEIEKLKFTPLEFETAIQWQKL